MTGDTFEKILAEFKENETADSVVSMIDSKELRNGVAAWKSVVFSYKDNMSTDAVGEAARWNFLWECVEYDYASFGVVAGLKSQEVGNILKRLIGLRLVYPDGTVSRLASNFLSAVILKQTGRPPRKSESPGKNLK